MKNTQSDFRRAFILVAAIHAGLILGIILFLRQAHKPPQENVTWINTESFSSTTSLLAANTRPMDSAPMTEEKPQTQKPEKEIYEAKSEADLKLSPVEPPQPPQPPQPPPPPPPQQLFGCVFTIPNNQLTQRAVNEGGEFLCTDDNILCLTYGSFNIKDALAKYIELQDGYGREPGNEVVRKIQIDAAQQRNQFQVLGITYASSVFQDVILQQLLTRFSIIPKGKQFTITASTNMGTLLRELLTALVTNLKQVQPGIVQLQVQRDIFATLCKNLVTTLLPRVKELNIYTPGKHDKSKFENFPMVSGVCTSRYFRTKWIIYLVRGILNIFNTRAEIADSFVYKNMKLFILLLKYLINEDEIVNLDRYITTAINIFEGVDLAIRITLQNLVQVNVLIDSEYPNIDAGCVLRAKQVTVATEMQPPGTSPKQSKKKLPPKKVSEVEEKPQTGVNKKELTTALDKTTKTKAKVNAVKAIAGLARLAGVGNIAASPPVSKVPKKQGGPGGVARGGGTIRTRNPHSPKKTNNHTRKNKYKRNNKNKKHKSSPKYRKVNPSSRSGSQSNRKKSKSKLPHKNVTFKRRRYNNK